MVYEATFGNLDTAKSLIDCFRDNGYRVAVLALPVNLALSIQRNESRYQIKLEDIHTLPRKVSLLDIQKMSDNFINNINKLEECGVTVCRVSSHQNARLVLSDMIANFQAAWKKYLIIFKLSANGYNLFAKGVDFCIAQAVDLV